MTTSTAPRTLGGCVVCGKASSTRCSKCNKAGIDWMFFCSQEHQTLIWSSHKRVCGSNPFKWPPLNQDEVDDLLRLLKEPLYTSTNVDPYNRARHSLLDSEVRKKNFSNLAEAEAHYAQRAKEASKPIHSEEAVRRLLALRMTLFDLKNREMMWRTRPVIGAMASPDNFLRVVAQSPFDYLAEVVGNSVIPCYINSINTSKYTLLHHRLVILIALGSLRHKEVIGSERRETLMSYCTHSLRMLILLAECGDIYMYYGALSDVFENLIPKLMKELCVANPSLSERLKLE